MRQPSGRRWGLQMSKEAKSLVVRIAIGESYQHYLQWLSMTTIPPEDIQYIFFLGQIEAMTTPPDEIYWVGEFWFNPFYEDLMEHMTRWYPDQDSPGWHFVG